MKTLRKTMKKTVSLLLSFVMILGLFAIIPSGSAETASSWESLIETFEYWSETTIKLTADVIAGESDDCITIPSGKNYTIDLDGHTLSRGLTTAAADGYVIFVKNGGMLTITDSSSDHSGVITGGYAKTGGAILNEGTLTIEGGTVTENVALGKGGAIYNKGTLTVSGGCITNNAADNGGGIYNSGDGEVTLCGDAEITANKSADIGGGVTNFGTLDISDNASVSYNYAYTEGGGIWNSGTLSMTGGLITGNSAAFSGSGICDMGVLNMKGSPVVEDNMGDDVFLSSGRTIYVTGRFNAEACIGVTSSAEKPVFTSGYGQSNPSDPSNYFFENGEDCVSVVLNGGEAKLNTDGYTYVERAWDAGNQTVTKEIFHLTNYITVSGSLNGLSKDNWYLVKGNVTLNSRIDNSGTANLLLCDGATVNFAEGIRNKQSMNSVLNIYGQPGGTGKLIADGGSYDVAAIGSDNEEKNGTINIYGGSVETTWDIGGGYKCAGGTIRVYGAKLSGGDIGCGQKSATDPSVFIGIYNSILHNTIHNGAGVLDLYNSSVDTHGLLTFSEAEIGGHEGCTQMGDINIVNSYINADSKIGRGAVIGSCADCDSGNIRIINSTVNAQCVNDNVYGIGYGAAIGGGKGGRGGNIVIENSCVVAKAFTGAGIGGGEGCSGDSITITDSVVMTSTCKGGAGIGGGDNGHGGNITINYSVVHSETSSEGCAPKAIKKLDSAAMSMMFEMMRLMLNGFKGNGSQVAYYHAGYIVAAFLTYLLEPTHVGAAIGGGDSGDSGTINITDSDITAIGGKYAAGIGGGDEGGCNNITIVNSTVDATGGDYAAGIGSGDEAEKMETIKIIGSTVTASSKDEGAGIGGGNDTSNHEIIIEDSTVTATGGDYAAGIGGGDDGDGGAITISNSDVTATGGKDGAGIGGGEDGDGGTVEIWSSNVKATGKHYGAGIGCGEDGDSATIKIYDGSTVEATAGGSGYATAIGKGDYVISSAEVYAFIADGLVVKAGSSSSDVKSFVGQDRYNAIKNSKYAKIYPCEHSTSTWCYENGYYHRKKCTECGSFTGEYEQHNWGSDNRCIVCGASAVMATLTIIEKNSAGDEVTSHIEAPKYTEATLPECTNVPDGMAFICWKVEDEETYYEPGETRQVFNDTIIALYLPVVTAQFIDSEGRPGTVQARRLSDEIGFLSAGWYVADGDLDYSQYGGKMLIASGDVRIILAEGVTVLMGGEPGPSSYRAITAKSRLSTFSIYGQAEQSGVIRCENDTIDLANFNLYGGGILSTGRVTAAIDMRIVRGTLTADYIHGGKSLTVSGGNLEAEQFVTNINNQLGWTNLSDSICFSEINVLSKGSITIAEGQALTDGVNIYTGTLTSEQAEAIQGRTLTPYPLHHFDEPEWIWSDDCHHATAQFICTDDECDYTAEVDAVVTRKESDNRIVYTARAEWGGETYTGTKIQRLSFFAGHSLSLKGDIGVNFYLDLTEEEAGSASINFIWFDKEIENAPIALDPNGSGYYKASCPIAVAEMTYPITATLTLGDESYTDTYSAKQYAEVILSSDYKNSYTGTGSKCYENLERLVKTMLFYGAKSQIQFGRNTDSLADTGIVYSPEEVTAAMIGDTGASDMTGGLPDGVAYKGTTIVYLSKTSMRHYYSGSMGDVAVTFNGKAVDPIPKGSGYYFELNDIPAPKLGELYILKIGDNEYRYSAVEYVKTCLLSSKTSDPMKDLAKATYLYYQAAAAYFG